MSNKNYLYDFILRIDNEELSNWAYTYLSRRVGATKQSSRESDFLALQRCLYGLEENHQKLVLRDMKEAYRQKKHREKQKRNGHSPSSFILSNGALRKLKQLARENNCSMKETLEMLIEGTYMINKAEKQRTKAAKRAKSPEPIRFGPTY